MRHPNICTGLNLIHPCTSINSDKAGINMTWTDVILKLLVIGLGNIGVETSSSWLLTCRFL